MRVITKKCVWAKLVCHHEITRFFHPNTPPAFIAPDGRIICSKLLNFGTVLFSNVSPISDQDGHSIGPAELEPGHRSFDP